MNITLYESSGIAITDVARAIGYDVTHTCDLQKLCREKDLVEYNFKKVFDF